MARRSKKSNQGRPRSGATPIAREPLEEQAPQERFVKAGARLLLCTHESDYFERFCVNPLSQFAIYADNSGLCHLAERIISAIIEQGLFNANRKLATICLHYIQSSNHSSFYPNSSFPIDWQEEFIRSLFFRASQINALLTGNLCVERPILLASRVEAQSALFSLLKPQLSGSCPKGLGTTVPLCIFDFFNLRSLPDLGFDTSRFYNSAWPVNSGVRNQKPSSLAIASAEYAAVFFSQFSSALQDSLLIDEVYAEHPRLFEELLLAFDAQTQLPQGLLKDLRMHIRLSPSYDTLYKKLTHPSSSLSVPSRKSRLNLQFLELWRQFFLVLSQANKERLALSLMLV